MDRSAEDWHGDTMWPRRRATSAGSVVVTLACVALLLVAKLGAPPGTVAASAEAAAAPSLGARVLAARELLTGRPAVAVDTGKMAEMKAAAMSGKQGSLIKAVQKLDSEAAPAQEEAPAEEVPAAAAPPAKPEEGEEMAPGWDKSMWSSGDWASWVITGPFITLCFSFFMFYTYGVPAGALTALICLLVDIATFYYNW